jgi:hypothetical protein
MIKIFINYNHGNICAIIGCGVCTWHGEVVKKKGDVCST